MAACSLLVHWLLSREAALREKDYSLKRGCARAGRFIAPHVHRTAERTHACLRQKPLHACMRERRLIKPRAHAGQPTHSHAPLHAHRYMPATTTTAAQSWRAMLVCCVAARLAARGHEARQRTSPGSTGSTSKAEGRTSRQAMLGARCRCLTCGQWQAVGQRYKRHVQHRRRDGKRTRCTRRRRARRDSCHVQHGGGGGVERQSCEVQQLHASTTQRRRTQGRQEARLPRAQRMHTAGARRKHPPICQGEGGGYHNQLLEAPST
jgi:hypothetical protein